MRAFRCPMVKIPDHSASEMLHRHGRGALQIAIDEIVRAVRRGDDEAAVAWHKILRAMERQLAA